MSNCSKYNVGLMLDATIDEYINFFENYAIYIHSIYFSLPLGRRFHTREHIANQFENLDNIRKFWEILKVVEKYGIPLEMVLNTSDLTNKDIENAFELLKSRRVDIQYVNILDKYYEVVEKVCPTAKKIYSYNNFLNDISDIPSTHNYEYVVVGGKNIRNFRLCDEIRKNSRIILLLNNGCNHYCGWCKADIEHCKKMFEIVKTKLSVENMYAIQSIMPFEINEGLIPMEDGDLFKINCRNANFAYLNECIKSYVFNMNSETMINKESLSYWSRLAWFYDYFEVMNFNSIMDYKASLYQERR